MNTLKSKNLSQNLQSQGFATLPALYSRNEIDSIAAIIDQIDPSRPECRSTSDLFAIRQFLKFVPAIQLLLFTPGLKELIYQTFGRDYFIVKSIYFDKPPGSNWFVAWHQDLTITGEPTKLSAASPPAAPC